MTEAEKKAREAAEQRFGRRAKAYVVVAGVEFGFSSHRQAQRFADAAERLRRDAIEECAKVADGHAVVSRWAGGSPRAAAIYIAAAIRALAEKPQGG